MSDTIYAVATAPGRAALAVLRISGPSAAQAVGSLCALPPPRRASVRRLVDPVSRETLDEALVLYMPGPRSFTGEDVVELHLHGGRAVIEGVVDALARRGLRSAAPGEFTRRAFEAGRLDLIQAEAVADLIDAESAAQRRQALGQLGGTTAEVVARWRGQLLDALAALEAAIDFPDEDLPSAVAERAKRPLSDLVDALVAAAGDRRGEQIRDGYRVALIGAPNAGKSSLLNRLIGREAAIVTDTPGTTRDVIEQPLDVDGYRVLIADTAGLRPTEERIEAEGVRRARAWADGADLRLWVVDGSTGEGAWSHAVSTARQGDLIVFNKNDLPAGPDAAAARDAADALELEPVDCSTRGSEGCVAVVQALHRRVLKDLGGAPPAATRERHRQLLSDAATHLARALQSGRDDAELMAEDVRLAARSLEALTGRVGTEEVLGAVFSRFCIGK